MVSGNKDAASGSGVVFTRSPSDGTPEPYGEFLTVAQGEDVVSGGRTPRPISSMADAFPGPYADLLTSLATLEAHWRDMMDCEFTVQSGELFMLQTRVGKRTGGAALRIAADLVGEGVVSPAEAVLYVEPKHLDQLLHPALEPGAEKAAAAAGALLGTGLAASPGAAVGRLVLDAPTAEAWAEEGKGPVILARTETNAEDVGGMWAAAGLVTARGGMTSHAAVVARGWGRPCVCGVGGLVVDAAARTVTFTAPRPDGQAAPVLAEGDWVSVSGTDGAVYSGRLPVIAPTVSGRLEAFLAWADAERVLGVRANADTPADVAVAIKNGADGVGLVRTEHMFFASPARLGAMRRMIGAAEVGTSAADEASPLAELRRYQAADFEGILEAAGGRPVTIRLLDPPLHEFLPPDGSPALAALIEELAAMLKLSPDLVARRLRAMHEVREGKGSEGGMGSGLGSAGRAEAEGAGCPHPHTLTLDSPSPPSPSPSSRPTPCSASGAAAWASCTRRSPACRWARSWTRPWRSPGPTRAPRRPARTSWSPSSPGRPSWRPWRPRSGTPRRRRWRRPGLARPKSPTPSAR